jgi:hypothetical protein
MPLFLFGLCVAAIALFLFTIGGPSEIVSLARGPVWHYGALVVGLAALAALVTVAGSALRGRLPAWSYTWIGAMLAGTLIALNLVVEDRAFVLAPAVDVALLVLLALATLITYGSAASRGWPHSGLYTVGVCGTLGLALCFFGVAGPFQTYLGGLAALLGILEAALVYAYLHGSNAVRVLCLAGVGVANVGIAWTVEWVFRSAHPDRGIEPFWSLAALLTALLVGGTLAGIPGAFLRRILTRDLSSSARSS